MKISNFCYGERYCSQRSSFIISTSAVDSSSIEVNTHIVQPIEKTPGRDRFMYCYNFSSLPEGKHSLVVEFINVKGTPTKSNERKFINRHYPANYKSVRTE